MDESSLTGEHRPILKEPGDAVASGTIPLDGSIEVCVKRVVADSTAAVRLASPPLSRSGSPSAADVGIALGTQTDLVCEAADIHILEPDLRKLVWLLIYARRVRRTIRGNLGWAFAYNGIALGLAAGYCLRLWADW